MPEADLNNTSLRYASDPDPTNPASSNQHLELTPINYSVPADQKGAEVLRIAHDTFTKTGNWVIFYRELLGVDGVVRKLFSTPEQLREFETTKEFGELQEMVAAIRSQDTSKGDSAEPERMITIRLPKSLHDALRAESDEMNLSINKLCISKLLQRIDTRCVPVQQGRRRGRRPGPQGPRKKVDQTAPTAPTATLSQHRVPNSHLGHNSRPSSLDD